MTAEIAVMNKSAIALAADSAVTVQSDRGEKIYNTVNKLFALSKRWPVGIMIYGNAQLNGVPWETIIKLYRQQLGDREFKTVQDFSIDFVRFLHKSAKRLFSAGEEQAVVAIVDSVLADIAQEVGAQARTAVEKEGQVTELQLRHIADRAVKVFHDQMFERQKAKLLPEATGKRIVRIHRRRINERIDTAFRSVQFGQKSRGLFLRAIGHLFAHAEPVSRTQTGVVFAGFGQQEHFPALVACETDGCFLERVRILSRHLTAISQQCSASVMPFAQGEMVYTFMEGIDPDLENVVQRLLSTMSGEVPETLFEFMKQRGVPVDAKTRTRFRKVAKTALQRSLGEMARFRRDWFWAPIVSAVSFLPKEELAAMAEALVNLTSFKRRVSLDAETVGGPIDVAVISKGDGFIWIKRKHYFEAQTNPQFFANYNRAEKNENASSS